jgi:hypothetical protein
MTLPKRPPIIETEEGHRNDYALWEIHPVMKMEVVR